MRKPLSIKMSVFSSALYGLAILCSPAPRNGNKNLVIKFPYIRIFQRNVFNQYEVTFASQHDPYENNTVNRLPNLAEIIIFYSISKTDWIDFPRKRWCSWIENIFESVYGQLIPSILLTERARKDIPLK